MNYLLVIKTTSNGTNDRTLTYYPDDDTALRKFHEAFNTIGGGPKRITAILLRDVTVQEAPNLGVFDASQLKTTEKVEVIRNETWVDDNIITDEIVMPTQDPNFIPVTD